MKTSTCTATMSRVKSVRWCMHTCSCKAVRDAVATGLRSQSRSLSQEYPGPPNNPKWVLFYLNTSGLEVGIMFIFGALRYGKKGPG